MAKLEPLALLALSGLALLVVASNITATSYAQTEPWVTPLDVRVQVTDVLREHGTFSDRWTFTANITNRENEAITMDISELYLDVGQYGIANDCISRNGIKLNLGQTKEFTACFLANSDLEPTSLFMSDYVFSWETAQVHVAPFVSGECAKFGDGPSCGRIQNIDRLIRDMEPEPMTCEAPTTTTPQPADEPDTDQPQLLSAAYHKLLGDLLLSFDESVTLVDNWQDNITIGGFSIGELANNLMPDASSLVWISADYTVYNDILNAKSHTVIIEPNTFLDTDGNTNDLITIRPTVTRS